MPKSRKRTTPARKKSSKIAVQKRISKAQQRLENFRALGVEKMTAALDAVSSFENGLAKSVEQLIHTSVAIYQSTVMDFQTRFIHRKVYKKKISRTAKAVTAAIPNSPKIGLTFLALGVILLLFPTAYKYFHQINPSESLPSLRTNTNKVMADQKNGSQTIINSPIKIDSRLLSDKEPSQPPQRIVVPSLNLDLPIVESKVVNGLWEVSETTASHGVGSANPGEIGNTVIFAHARDGLFAPLRNLRKDTIIYVLTKDRWYKYQAKGINLVNPNEIQVIAPTTDETLTLYTCSGFLDSKRLIVQAKPH